MLGLTALQARYTPFKPSNNEEFSSASRSVKPGLIASGIVSAWTWAATLVRNTSLGFFIPFDLNLYTLRRRCNTCSDLYLSLHSCGRYRSSFAFYGPQLQSSAVAYKYGISGPWWYGSGATIQVLLFAQVRMTSPINLERHLRPKLY